jgi:hypothetical protein
VEEKPKEAPGVGEGEAENVLDGSKGAPEVEEKPKEAPGVGEEGEENELDGAKEAPGVGEGEAEAAGTGLRGVGAPSPSLPGGKSDDPLFSTSGNSPLNLIKKTYVRPKTAVPMGSPMVPSTKKLNKNIKNTARPNGFRINSRNLGIAKNATEYSKKPTQPASINNSDANADGRVG